MKNSKAELQTLQENKMTLEIVVEKNAQSSLAELQKLQLELQVMRTERTDLQVSYETLSLEKVQLQNKVIELESEKAATEERGKQYQMQVEFLEGQNASLIASLKLCYGIEDGCPTFERICSSA